MKSMVRIKNEVEHLEAKIHFLKEKIGGPHSNFKVKNDASIIKELIDAKVALSERLEAIAEESYIPEYAEAAAKSIAEASFYAEYQKDYRITADLKKRAATLYEEAAEIANPENAKKRKSFKEISRKIDPFLDFMKESKYRGAAQNYKKQAKHYRREVAFEKVTRGMSPLRKKIIRYIKGMHVFLFFILAFFFSSPKLTGYSIYNQNNFIINSGGIFFLIIFLISLLILIYKHRLYIVYMRKCELPRDNAGRPIG